MIPIDFVTPKIQKVINFEVCVGNFRISENFKSGKSGSFRPKNEIKIENEKNNSFLIIQVPGQYLVIICLLFNIVRFKCSAITEKRDIEETLVRSYHYRIIETQDTISLT